MPTTRPLRRRHHYPGPPEQRSTRDLPSRGRGRFPSCDPSTGVRSPRLGQILALRFWVAPGFATCSPERPDKYTTHLPGPADSLDHETGGEPVDIMITALAEPAGWSDFGISGFGWFHRLSGPCPRKTR